MGVPSGKILFPFVSGYLLLCLYLYFTEKRSLAVKLFLVLFFFALSFGLFSLVYVLIDVFKLENSPEAFNNLKKEVQKCKKELESLGFKFK